MKILILLAAITLASCQTIATVPALPLPDQPNLPAIPGPELACISNEAYEALVLRDRLWENYAETLQNIIKATHE